MLSGLRKRLHVWAYGPPLCSCGRKQCSICFYALGMETCELCWSRPCVCGETRTYEQMYREESERLFNLKEAQRAAMERMPHRRIAALYRRVVRTVGAAVYEWRHS